MDRPLRPILVALALLAWALVPASGRPGRVSATLRNDGPNARDHDRSDRGYYERLITEDRRSPADPGVLAMNVEDVREYVLKSNFAARHKGATWTSNALGMRDRDYGVDKPAGTLRIALVGDSIACGWGVDDGLGFEPILEHSWDDRATASGRSRTIRSVEVLNFAVPGHAPGQRWEHFRRIGWQTGPDLVIFEATLADLGWDERRLRVLLPRGVGFDAPVYRETLRTAGITSPPIGDLKALLRPHREAILAGVYRRAAADCRARGVPAVWVLLPRVGKPIVEADRERLIEFARAAGFDRVIDLSDAFDGRSASSLAIAPGDFHPNAEGHAILARRLDAAIGEFVSSLTVQSRPKDGGVAAPPQRPQAAGVDPR